MNQSVAYFKIIILIALLGILVALVLHSILLGGLLVGLLSVLLLTLRLLEVTSGGIAVVERRARGAAAVLEAWVTTRVFWEKMVLFALSSTLLGILSLEQNLQLVLTMLCVVFLYRIRSRFLFSIFCGLVLVALGALYIYPSQAESILRIAWMYAGIYLVRCLFEPAFSDPEKSDLGL